MLRISPIDSDNHHVRLRLEGRIVGPWVTELRATCEQILEAGHALQLNLAEVSFLDQSGAALVASIRDRGVELMECSSFVSEQLKAV